MQTISGLKVVAPLLPDTPSVLANQSCVFQKRLETELMFVPVRVNRYKHVFSVTELLGNTGSEQLNRVTARLLSVV